MLNQMTYPIEHFNIVIMRRNTRNVHCPLGFTLCHGGSAPASRPPAMTHRVFQSGRPAATPRGLVIA
jgi:hypothetical protein